MRNKTFNPKALSISLKTNKFKNIETCIMNELTIDGSFIQKETILFYFYNPSEKVYEVGSKEFIDIIYDTLSFYKYKLPKGIDISYKIIKAKTHLSILFT